MSVRDLALIDHDLLEERLIELTSEMVGREVIHTLTVSGNRKCLLQRLLYVLILELGSRETSLSLSYHCGDAFLLALEEVQRNSTGIVRLQEFGAFLLVLRRCFAPFDCTSLWSDVQSTQLRK